LYRCGVAFSGIANLGDFARAMPPYWGPIRTRWLLRVGNVTADDALNRRLSPVFHAGKMQAPLLMGQGGNDVRVTKVGLLVAGGSGCSLHPAADGAGRQRRAGDKGGLLWVGLRLFSASCC
jgi:hypothetical protein